MSSPRVAIFLTGCPRYSIGEDSTLAGSTRYAPSDDSSKGDASPTIMETVKPSGVNPSRPWKQEEQQVVQRLVSEYGTCWKFISKKMASDFKIQRSDSSIRNFWNRHGAQLNARSIYLDKTEQDKDEYSSDSDWSALEYSMPFADVTVTSPTVETFDFSECPESVKQLGLDPTTEELFAVIMNSAAVLC